MSRNIRAVRRANCETWHPVGTHRSVEKAITHNPAFRRNASSGPRCDTLGAALVRRESQCSTSCGLAERSCVRDSGNWLWKHGFRSVCWATVVASIGITVCACDSDLTALAVRVSALEKTLGCGTSVAPASPAPSHYPFECVSWQKLDDGIELRITNLHAACGIVAKGVSASRDASVLKLGVVGDDGSGCGWCAYDISVEIDGVADAQQLDLDVRSSATSEDHPVQGFIDISRNEGTICRYPFRSTFEEAFEGGPRRGCGVGDLPACFEGTTCAGGFPNQAGGEGVTGDFCLPSCGTDDECWDIERCVDGLCELAEMW